MAKQNKKHTKTTTRDLGEGQYAAAAGTSSTRHRSIRGRKGGLKDMPQMPLDILFEIFGHLKPMDLLNISRISKPFRHLLMSRGSISLWKASRKNVPGIPDCPSFLTEPAYANLCFYSRCHNCLKPNAQMMCWEVGARYCLSCNNLLFHVPPQSAYGDISLFNQAALFPIPDEIVGKNGSDCGNMLYYHKPTIEAFKKRWATLASDEERKEAVAEHQMRKDERVKFARACEVWLSQRKDTRKREIIQLKRDRMEEVCRRLVTLGYGEDLEYSNEFYRFRKHPLWEIPNVIQSKPWTERSWNNMKGKILEFMDAVRVERLFLMRMDAIEPRVKLLEDVLVSWRISTGVISPHTYDFLFVPEVKSLIDAPPNGKVSVPVTREDLEKLEPVFYRYHKEWKQKGLETIENLVSIGLSLPRSSALCALAISQFAICSGCSMAVSFANALVHRCISRSEFSGRENTYESVITELTHRSMAPTLEHLILAEGLRDIIVACGQDPTAVTANEMDALDVRLECRACRTDGFVNVFNWRRAFKHSRVQYSHRSNYAFKRPPVWQQVPLTYISIIKELESKLLSNDERERQEGHQIPWFCAHCPRSLDFNAWYCVRNANHATRNQVIRHLSTSHDVDDPTEDDYYVNPWHEGYASDSHWVSLIFNNPVPRLVEHKLAKGEAKIIDPLPDETSAVSL
ncbi:hypothetical protein QCA50_020032 [Cerrena zonata]|uniref:F-box domain-containing protein n=1 Tax=Cerrena zonata TaxID=2478898 RepID=A0AAW0F8L0_9APHY